MTDPVYPLFPIIRYQAKHWSIKHETFTSILFYSDLILTVLRRTIVFMRDVGDILHVL
jgi:hypothetical protein